MTRKLTTITAQLPAATGGDSPTPGEPAPRDQWDAPKHQVPAIGRIVIFRESGFSARDGTDESGATVDPVKDHPAIITRVWSTTVVNLQVFYDDKTAQPRTEIHELEVEDATIGYGPNKHWYWPPARPWKK